MIKEIKIDKIVPANVWYYMYVYSDEGNYFIYAHRDRVSYFAQKKAENISKYEDTINKLICLKYFEGEDLKLDKNAILDLEEKTKFGTCLISEEIDKHYKAEVWIDNINEEVTFKLFDSGNFKGVLDSDIDLASNE